MRELLRQNAPDDDRVNRLRQVRERWDNEDGEEE
jgi:hypothetical protein